MRKGAKGEGETNSPRWTKGLAEAPIGLCALCAGGGLVPIPAAGFCALRQPAKWPPQPLARCVAHVFKVEFSEFLQLAQPSD